MPRYPRSSAGVRGGHRHTGPSSYQPMSYLSAQTLSRIRHNISWRTYVDPRTRYIIHDNNCPGYEWLLPGWLAEERHKEYGRVYRYYYDPSGRMYISRREVILAWEESGLIMIEG